MALEDEDKKKVIEVSDEASGEIVDEVSKTEEVIEPSPVVAARTAYQEMLAKQRGELDEKQAKDKDSIKRQRQNQLLGDAVNSLLGSTVGASGGVIGNIPKKDDSVWNRLNQKEDAYDAAYDNQLSKYNAAILGDTYANVQHEERMAELMEQLANKKSEREASQKFTAKRDRKNREQRTKEMEYISPLEQARIDLVKQQAEADKAKDAAELSRQAKENEADNTVDFNGELNFTVTKDVFKKISNIASTLATEILGESGFSDLVEEAKAAGMDDDEARSSATNKTIDNLISALYNSGVSALKIEEMLTNGDSKAILTAFRDIPIDDRSNLEKKWQSIFNSSEATGGRAGGVSFTGLDEKEDGKINKENDVKGDKDKSIDNILNSGAIDPNINDQDDGLL